MRFLSAEDGATVKFNGALGTAWQVTLGGNRTLVFVNFENGDTVSVKLIQDGTGSRTVTWGSNIVFPGGVPTLQTTANTVDTFNFVYDGTNFREISGARAFVRRVAEASLRTIVASGAGAVVGITLWGGGGEGEAGTGPNLLETKVLSGTQVNSVMDSTGSILIGSGKLIVGSVKDDAAAKFKVTVAGTTTVRATASGDILKGGGGDTVINGDGVVTKDTLSGGTLKINKQGAGSGEIKVSGSDGARDCFMDTDGAGYTFCEYLNGVQTCKNADNTGYCAN